MALVKTWINPFRFAPPPPTGPVEFPPVSLNAGTGVSGTYVNSPSATAINTTTVTITGASGATYGLGTYIVRDSGSLFAGRSYGLFDKSQAAFPAISISAPDNGFTGAGNSWSAGAGTGNIYQLNVGGTNINGAWISLQLPTAITLTSYTIQGTADADANFAPSGWRLIGSTNGTTWAQIDIRSGVTLTSTDTTRTYSVTVGTAYNYYALQFTNGRSTRYIVLNEWRLVGTL